MTPARRKRLPWSWTAIATAGILCLNLITVGSSRASAQVQIRVEQVWARPGIAAMAPSPGASPSGQMMQGGNSAIYMVIHNDGEAADRLTAAETDVARNVELHETRMEGTMGQMFRVPNIPIPGRGRVELKPGGLHVMLIGLRRELKMGDRFPITLVFERAGRVSSSAEVRMTAP